MPPAITLVERIHGTLKQFAQLNMLTTTRHHLPATGPAASVIEQSLESARDALFDELTALTQTATDVPSRTDLDIAGKARLYLEFCMPEDGDVAHELAASICRDLLESRQRM